jgi:hypothetical protein
VRFDNPVNETEACNRQDQAATAFKPSNHACANADPSLIGAMTGSHRRRF